MLFVVINYLRNSILHSILLDKQTYFTENKVIEINLRSNPIIKPKKFIRWYSGRRMETIEKSERQDMSAIRFKL